ncbi:MAG: flavodoxin family protein [Desulfobacula sp.]|nr:flavodoxin family protein [Desulfobacula sp.]
MYALAINGSPRKGGNTELMLKKVLSELNDADWKTELVTVGGTAIRGCRACEKCFETQDNQCSTTRDKFNEIYLKMIKADAMILGSPTYYAAVSADLKALIERAGYVAYANKHAFSGKIGAAVVTAWRGGAIHVYDTINHMFQMSRMIIPGSTYWNMGFGLEKGEVMEDEEGLANMRHLGKSIDWLGRAIKLNNTDYPKE